MEIIEKQSGFDFGIIELSWTGHSPVFQRFERLPIFPEITMKMLLKKKCCFILCVY